MNNGTRILLNKHSTSIGKNIPVSRLVFGLFGLNVIRCDQAINHYLTFGFVQTTATTTAKYFLLEKTIIKCRQVKTEIICNGAWSG